MELREPIEEINEKLVREFGRSIDDGRANFRVVWSDDQFEKRVTTHDDRGNELIMPEVRLLPKYRQYIQHRYVLERITVVLGDTDLLEKTPYEVVWTFQDKKGKYLPPYFEGCKFLIEHVLSNIGKARYTKYKDDMSKEKYEQDVQKMQNELFGNETEVGDALSYGYGVSLSGPKFGDNNDGK